MRRETASAGNGWAGRSVAFRSRPPPLLSSAGGVMSAAEPGGRTIRGDWGHLMLGERIASQSEVLRAIMSGYSPCCGVPNQGAS